jgi:tetratricopeptide (TPR) repeat protein
MSSEFVYSSIIKVLSRLPIFVFCCLLPFMNGCRDKAEQSEPVNMVSVSNDRHDKTEFVNRERCIECHKEQYMEWLGSHHDLAMDVASDETVKGDFNNSSFTYQGVTVTFYRSEGKYFIRSEGPGSEIHEYVITYVLGVSPLQQYMTEFPDGRIQLPDIAWDTRPENRGGQRWVHLNRDDNVSLTPDSDRTIRFLNWNSMCGDCHITNFRKNYNLKTDSFKTEWTMIDVGCQACHGPGSNHIKWAESETVKGSTKVAYDTMGLDVNLRADNSRVQIDACARCHSSRKSLRKDYEYGRPFMDYYVPRVLTDPLYYPDGQILGEVYVYGSFLQAKKYQHGVRCTDCHDPHTARLRAYGNELCIHCHSSPPAPQFASLRDKDYESPVHHFHKENSPGAQCVECHMPETKYMIVDPRRDHSFQIPRPDLSVKLNIPNPCNRCHTDKSAQWAADKINEVHPSTRSGREKETHFAGVFAAGQDGAPEAEPGLIKIAGNRSLPSIVRATALNILSKFRTENATDMTASSLSDEDPLVRYEAVKGISELISKTAGAGDQKKKYSLLAPLMIDTVRAVRSEAARAVAEVPHEFHAAADKNDFEGALEEYKEQQESISERPDAHLNLGILYEDLGEDEMAAASYAAAVRLVNDFFPARFKLADLFRRTGRNNEAEQQYREVIGLDPGQGKAQHLLGLLLSEGNRLDEAVSLLGRSVEILPADARVRYDYALTLRHLGRSDEALTEMISAYEINPRDPAVVQAVAVFFIQDKQWERALSFAELLVRLAPEAERPKHMLKQIQQNIKAGKETVER